MPSRFFDAARASRYQRSEYEFPERTLAGRVVVAAGGAGGLGAATVTLLVREGATVVVGYRKNRSRAEQLSATLNHRGPGRVHLVEGDLCQASARDRLVRTAAAQGDIYALVNFLGDPARVDFAALDEAAMQQSWATNYIAPLLLARQVGQHMLEHKTSGALVFLATMQAVAVFESSINYAGAKAALLQAARVLAKQWGPQIRVNVVAPGVTMVGMAEASIESGKYDGFVKEKVIPRFGRPEDIARLIRLLLEPDNYITGQVITVDGGLTLRRDRG
jgi:pteridine reductase